MKKLFASLLLASTLWNPVSADPASEFEKLQKTVAATVSMVRNGEARQAASQHGLDIVNVTWEDTGRYKGSAVGPNISDMTLQVQLRDPKTDAYSLHCLPVIRHPNFSDKTADLTPDKFFLLVGNESGQDAKKVSLREYLGSLRSYLSEPDSWKGEKKSLLTDSDSHVLVSAQACFLPIPKGGRIDFNPVLFNYQSYQGQPAVLTVMATREGTSATIIDNTRDAFEAGQTWGQRLFFNKNGERASFTGTRLSDFQSQTGTTDGPGVTAAGEEGLNMVLLIQVPLKQREQDRRGGGNMVLYSAPTMQARSVSTVENAVIGHGKVEGPFTEIDGLAIERDERFPIRVTVQFYKATDNGVVGESDLKEIADQLDRVYKEGDYVGSLVTGGETGRPTEYDGDKTEPAGWWSDFYRRYTEEMGKDWTGLETLMQTLDLKP